MLSGSAGISSAFMSSIISNAVQSYKHRAYKYWPTNAKFGIENLKLQQSADKPHMHASAEIDI